MNKKSQHNIDAIKKAADIFGSLSKLSREVGVTYASAFNWVHGKSTPSPMHCMRIEKITNGQVKKEDILPCFDWNRFTPS